MEFDKSRVFTAVNADELREGDKVIVAFSLKELREKVIDGKVIFTIDMIYPEADEVRFRVRGESGWSAWSLAYFVKRKENKYEGQECNGYVRKTTKPKQKAEKHYRPFKDTDELVKVWVERTKPYRVDTRIPPLIMPLIWVREKGCEKSADLITCYGSKGITVRGKGMYFDTLFAMFEFLDGSPCGVEAKE